MEKRKITFKLYSTAAQSERLAGWVCLHGELYNAALQDRIDAYRKAGKSVTYFDQQNTLPEIKKSVLSSLSWAVMRCNRLCDGSTWPLLRFFARQKGRW